MTGPEDAVGELAELRDVALGCTRCALAGGRTQVVFGVGNLRAELMFVGEAPGRQEDLMGEPFVGRSGKLLDTLMAQEIGIDRTQCYVANILKCLRSTAQVQLGDGSWERIGRLVRSRYGGTVKSVDAGGRVVDRRVVGWYASPLAGRRVYRLSHRTAEGVGTTARGDVEVTGDHEVLTGEGWVRVDGLYPGARIATGQGLSPVAHDVIVGSLLGDASVPPGSARVQIGRSRRQLSYARFKASHLAELGALVGAGGEVASLTAPSIRTIAHDFSSGGEKRVPVWVADDLNPRSLAVWFMDEGHLRSRPPGQPLAEIATWAFGVPDLEILQKALARLDLSAQIRRRRLSFDVPNTRLLARTIAPYVPPCLRHKLPRDVEAERPFAPALFDDKRPVVQYDEAVVEEVTLTGTDETLFCIDVEETHNFVTAGGVVHNCRPPGNRDPLPEEITACRPYLDRQIELIAPSVVITLGNFATRVLLDTNEGITRLRGRVYPFMDGNLVPTYHPAAALRGGGEKVAEMRADFVRAKGLLGRRR
jgi:uracil-DNA glycosylase family 4